MQQRHQGHPRQLFAFHLHDHRSSQEDTSAVAVPVPLPPFPALFSADPPNDSEPSAESFIFTIAPKPSHTMGQFAIEFRHSSVSPSTHPPSALNKSTRPRGTENHRAESVNHALPCSGKPAKWGQGFEDPKTGVVSIQVSPLCVQCTPSPSWVWAPRRA